MPSQHMTPYNDMAYPKTPEVPKFGYNHQNPNDPYAYVENF
jgi:hypothetical protein